MKATHTIARMDIRVATVVAVMLAVSGCGVASLSGSSGTQRGDGGVTAAAALRAARVTIDRDEFGVPYIEGIDESDVEYALGYAMSEDGFYALEDAYAAALGRAARYYGRDRLAGDELRASLRVVSRARDEFRALAPADRALLQSFVDGVNAYMHDHPGEPPRHIAKFEAWMPIVYANDVAWVQGVERAMAGAPDTSVSVTLAVATGAAPGARASMLLIASRDRLPYEMNVRTSDGFAFHGFTTSGMPFAREGFSARIAYASTQGAVPALVTINASAVVTSHTDSIEVNTENGLTVRAVKSMKSADGAVVSVRNGIATVLRATTMPSGVLQEMHRRMHAGESAAVQSASGVTFAIDSTSASAALVFAPGRQQSAEALMLAETAWTIQKLIRVAFDTRVNRAGDEIAALADEWEQVGARNPEKAQGLDSAIAMLRSWNGESSVDSRAMTLYAEFELELERTPASSYRRFSALEAIVSDARRFPPQAWGSVNAIRRGASGAMPVAGAPLRTSTMFTYDAKSYMQSYVWAVDLKTGVAGSVLSYGAGYRPESPHWFDQAALFAAGSLKPAALSRGASRPYHPGEGAPH